MRLPRLPVHRRGSIRAVTWIEVLAILFILILLAWFLLPMLAVAKDHGHGRVRIKCVNNLKNIGLGIRIFATDNEGQFPWMVPVEKGGSLEELADDSRIWRHFQALSNELSTPKLLICPTSERTVATGFGPRNTNDPSPQLQFSHNDHVSYFLTTGVTEEDADRILGGDRNLTLNSKPIRGRINPGTNDVLGFTKPGHHDGAGNLLFGDGSVRQISRPEAARSFTAGLAPVGTNPPPTLLIP